MLGLSPYGREFMKLAVSREASTFAKSRKKRRSMRVETLLKKKAGAAQISDQTFRRLGYGSLLAAGSVGTVGAQSVARDYGTGKKYRKAMEAQEREMARQRKARGR